MYDHIKISVSLCLVVRGRHVGGVISWGRHDRFPFHRILGYILSRLQSVSDCSIRKILHRGKSPGDCMLLQIEKPNTI